MPFDDPSLNAYRHREVRFQHAGRTLTCTIGNSLFSRGGVDVGTRALIDSLIKRREPAKPATEGEAQPSDAPSAILDVGCGWGALALTLAAEYPQATVVGLDRDWLAVRYTAANAAANQLDNVITLPSLSYSGLFTHGGEAIAGPEGDIPLPEQYDWIVSNLPAKAGETGLLDLVFGAGPLLRPGGRIAVVFVRPLEAAMRDNLALMRELTEVELAYENVRAEHIIWHLVMPAGLPLLRYDLREEEEAEEAQGTPSDGVIPFQRDDAPAVLDGATWEAVFNVPEFDTQDYRGDLLEKVVHQACPLPESGGETILLFQPMHGMLARHLIQARKPRRLIVVDRDLLAVAITGRNIEHFLAAQGEEYAALEVDMHLGVALGLEEWRATHGEEGLGSVDLIAGLVHAEEGRGGLRLLLEQSRAWLAPGGTVVLGLKAAEVSTLLKPAMQGLKLRTGRQLKRRGYAAQLLRPSS